MFGPVRPEVVEAEHRLGDRFDWTVRPSNYRELVEAVDGAVVEAKATRRVDDKRLTPEEDANRKAIVEARGREIRERREREEALMGQVRDRAPAGAEAVIVAELQKDTSDTMTDYFANESLRRVAIGYRFGKREDFAQLRRAAAAFEPTSHLGPGQQSDIEHRDNYSMGAGNYLSDHGAANWGSGWVVKSYPLAGNANLTEVAIPERPSAPAQVGTGVVMRPSSTGRAGFVELAFDDKPSPETIGELKAHGFRWARGNRCWYGRDTAFAEALTAGSGEG